MDSTLERALAAEHHASCSQSLLRGVAHELANITQMLALEPAPPEAIATAQQRLGTVLDVVSALAQPLAANSGPCVASDVLQEVSAWHTLQSGLPVATLVLDVAAPLPALSAAHAQVRMALLTMIAAAKRGGARTLALRVAPRASSVCCELTHDGATPPDDDARALLRTCGASVQSLAAGTWSIEFETATGLTGSA